jgi:PE-PPE domain
MAARLAVYRWEVGMSKPRLRASLVTGCAAVTGAMSIGLWAFPSEVKAIIAEARLLADEGWIMGGTDNPVPDQDYLNSVESLYLSQDSAYSFQGLTTPEQFCPIVCNASEPDLGFGDSVNQGVGDLNSVIVPALQGGNDVAVLGYSQSATVASVEMNDLLNNTPPGVNLNDLSVTLLGDPNSPIGGILDRFQFPDGVGAFSLSPEPQHVPFLDIPLSLATTPTTGIATDIYTGEYDGWANFPEDPSNIFADINALIGMETVHPYYPDPTPGVNLDTANIVNLGSIGDTNFYAIPAPLPTLAFMYDGGPAGRFFYDSFNPFASLTDDWAYGNPGDPGAGFEVNGVEPIGVAGPWQVDATGQLVESGVAGFIPKMDPLQMLAGLEYAGVQTFVGPIDDLLLDAGQSPLPTSFVDSLLSGYDATNQLDASLLTSWTDLTAGIPSLSPDAILDGSALISGQPLIDLVGYGFDIFNFFGA